MDRPNPSRTSSSGSASLAVYCLMLFNFLFATAIRGSEPADTKSTPASISNRTVSFTNDVIPILTKAGCNAGTCHAKAGNGQNGFELSLLGFEPKEDYAHIALEGRGRRVFSASPDHSLLLLKATNRAPHRGGQRLSPDTESYRLIADWIAQGLKYDGDSAPKLVSLEVQPQRGVLQRNSQQQLTTLATYSDQQVRDVTAIALYESNDTSMATVDAQGLVQTLDIPGKVSIMVRFQGLVVVFDAAVPQGSPVDNFPPSKNFIDEAVFANLKELGIPPSAVCDDSTFIRRVSLDIAGRLPTTEEVTSFQQDNSNTRRENVVERLLMSGEYADFFANKWTAMLKNRRDDASDIISNFAFYSWVRDNLLSNKPYDAMVRELLAATGTVIANPPVAWYKRVKDPKQQLEDVAQLFLGVRMQCAQCHHHPFERWSQDDYYSMAAFFSQVGRKPTATRGEDMIFHKRGLAGYANAKTGVVLRPAPLGSASIAISPDEDPRLRLADWMSSPENPFFARSLVNRYWKHFFKRGLIEPEDDIRDSNPPSNPQLLAALEKHFIDSDFNLKELVRVITTSQTYQLSAIPNEYNANDMQNYSHYYPRRLQAEVLLDSVDDLLGLRTEFPNLPSGTRAIALPDNSYNNASPFLRVFGRPENESVCECERIQSSSLAQSLHLMNSGDVKGKLANGANRVNQWLQNGKAPAEIIDELYRIAFSRDPSSQERETALAYVTEPKLDANGMPVDPPRILRENFHDLVWALMNSKEFLFNH